MKFETKPSFDEYDIEFVLYSFDDISFISSVAKCK